MDKSGKFKRLEGWDKFGIEEGFSVNEEDGSVYVRTHLFLKAGEYISRFLELAEDVVKLDGDIKRLKATVESLKREQILKKYGDGIDSGIRNGQIYGMRLSGMTYRDIGKIHGITANRVSAIIRRMERAKSA